MKNRICIILTCFLVLSALSFSACGKKHVIKADLAADPFSAATAGDAVVYVQVTDKDGENVTDAEGETVTAAVPAAPQTTDAASGTAETKTANGEKNPTEPADKKETQATAEVSSAADVVSGKGDYVLTLIPDKTEVKAGDELTVTYHMKNCKNVGCASFTVEAGKNVSVVDYESNDFVNYDKKIFEIYSNSTDEGVLFSGMSMTTCDFLDSDLFTVTYLIGDNVKKGDKLVFRVVPTTFLVGADRSGDQTKDICAELEKATAEVVVK